MRSLVVLCLLVTLILLHNTQSAPPKTQILALWNLGEVGECVLHYFPLVYNDYGCWCGFGGAHTPVDGIDDCCMHHDHCYDAAIESKACYDTPWEYIDNYSWKCNNRTPSCSAHNHACQSALCACDVAVTECWSKYPKPQKKMKCTHKM
ncbi:hypothetical protein Angca_010137, partial [Angiostrongylus cantonensis]